MCVHHSQVITSSKDRAYPTNKLQSDFALLEWDRDGSWPFSFKRYLLPLPKYIPKSLDLGWFGVLA